MIQQLAERGHKVTTVVAGEQFNQVTEHEYVVNPGRREDYDALFEALQSYNSVPETIVHLWGVTPDADLQLDLDASDALVTQSFYSLLYLAQAMGSADLSDATHLGVITNAMQEVVDGETKWPEKATVIGPCRAIAKEYPNITCQSIDIMLPQGGQTKYGSLANQLIGELTVCSTNSVDSIDSVVAYRGRHRWVQTFDQVRLTGREDKEGWTSRLRKEGVYLITGGLGGIGLELADYLAHTVQARLVLTGRSPFPAREEWNEWLATHDEDDVTSLKIRKLQTLEEMGSEVLVLRVDVTDLTQMQEAVEQVNSRFGSVNGVIHSAGVGGGGLIQLKTTEMAEEVMRPKVHGTRVLEQVLADQELDFLVLCSSRAAIMGSFGQVDYCAANAFLDAFAHYQMAQSDTFTVSINWAGWDEVGMRVETLAKMGVKPGQNGNEASISSEPAPEQLGPHPLLEKCILKTADQTIYSTTFSIEKHWVLEDHRILQKAVIPGVTYLEMVHAALAEEAGDRAIELSDLFFLSAIDVRDDEEKEIRTVLEKMDDGGYAFRMLYRPPGYHEGDAPWRETVLGKVHLVEKGPVKRHDVQAMIDRCTDRELIATDLPLTHDDLGPRWQNLRRAYIGQNEMVTVLELGEEFLHDLEDYKLHPALLDRTNGAAKSHLVGPGLYMPMGYKSITIKEPLPRKVYAYHTFDAERDPSRETLTFHVILMDEDGVELTVIDSFGQKRVHTVAEPLKRAASTQQQNGKVQHEELVHSIEQVSKSTEDEDAQLVSSNGMLNREGVEAFHRILASTGMAQIITSPNDLLVAIEHAKRHQPTSLIDAVEEPDEARPAYPRPELQTEYAAPRNQQEEKIAEIWEETLGIDQIGIHDNFFELGGDSVAGIQMIARFNRAGYQLSPQQLFQHQTVAELAVVLGADEEDVTTPEVVSGPAPLTPGQYEFIMQELPKPRRHSQTMLFEMQEPLDPGLLRAAVGELLTLHDALRLRIESANLTQVTPAWTQHIAEPDESIPFIALDLSSDTSSVQEAAIAAEIAHWRDTVNWTEEGLMQLMLFDLGPEQPAQLGIILHPLIADDYSWQLLIEDLLTVYRQLAADEHVRLRSDYGSFKQWAEQLVDYARSPQCVAEAAYWLTESRLAVEPLSVDFWDEDDADEAAPAAQCSLTVTLEEVETRYLQEDILDRHNVQVEEVLLAALIQSISTWADEQTLLIELVGDGRMVQSGEWGSAPRIGPCSASFPMLFDADDYDNPGELLKVTKEQRRRVPHNGLGYSLLCYLSGDQTIAEQLEEAPLPEVRLRYRSPLVGLAPELAPLSQPSNGTDEMLASDAYLFDIEVGVADGQLQANWYYSERFFRSETVTDLAQDFRTTLQTIIQYCQHEDIGYTPSDFAQANIDQKQLDSILAKLQQAE